MKKLFKKSSKLQLVLMSVIFITTGMAIAQDTSATLKKAGVKVVEGYNTNYKSHQSGGVTVKRNNMPLPEKTQIDDEMPMPQEADSAQVSPDVLKQNIDLNNQINDVTKQGKEALNNLGSDIPAISSPETQNKTIVKRTPSMNTRGPKIQSVDITHFNKNTLNEMESYGNAKAQEEYLKFRIQAEQNKNPPVQIRKP